MLKKILQMCTIFTKITSGHFWAAQGAERARGFCIICILDTSYRFHPRNQVLINAILYLSAVEDEAAKIIGSNKGLSTNKTLASVEDCDAQQSQHATSSAMAHIMHWQMPIPQRLLLLSVASSDLQWS